MVDIASTIMETQAGTFDPAEFNDRYQDALRELIEPKVKGLPRQKRKPVQEPDNVVDLMAALKRSLTTGKSASPSGQKRGAKTDKRQTNLLLPIKGEGGRAAAEKVQLSRRRKA
jgi:DNA end-binding protein Ku